MNTLAKAFIVINLVLGVAFLAVSCVLFAQQEVWKAKYNTQVKDHNEMVDAFEDIASTKELVLHEREKVITDLGIENGLLETAKAELEADLKIANNDLTGQKKRLNSLDIAMKNLHASFGKVESDKEDLESHRETLQRSLDIAQKQKDIAQDQNMKLTEETADLTMSNDMLSESVGKLQAYAKRLDNAIAKLDDDMRTRILEGATDVPPPIDAMVEGVDNETGTVVLSVGAEDDVRVGFTFIVYRDDSYIGQVQVDKVLPTNCAAQINSRMTRETIKPGDGATTRLGSL